MATTIRAELSEKNPYWIEKHRYYELKHFCLQYPIWKKIYRSLDGLSGHSTDFTTMLDRQVEVLIMVERLHPVQHLFPELRNGLVLLLKCQYLLVIVLPELEK